MTSRTERDRNSDRIEFISSHHPAIAPGEYTVQVAQELTLTAPAPVSQRYQGKPRKFRVEAPADRLNPAQIQSVFPPEGSLGDHALTLPHVVLTPSTLPWEWSGARPADPGVPWLALLLFTEEEFREVSVPAPSPEANPKSPAPARIEVPAGLLRKVMPRKSDLKWLTHVRGAVDATGKTEGDEVAVVMGHRLPGGGGSVVHLIALKEGFTDENFLAPSVSDSQKISLVTVKNWRFASVDPRQSFVALLRGLHQQVFRHGDSAHPSAVGYLKMGSSLLPHYMRQGNKSASWYRGPLVPGFHAPADAVTLPVRSSDELVRFNPGLGLFDVSYAVAWQLGRLMMLNSKGVSLDLYRWKLANARQIKDAESQIDHLPFDGPPADLALPPSVVRWFQRAALLEGVPFHNLVAEEKLLPTESIRFFEVDWRWVECMLDGAFSIGRVLAPDHQRDQRLRAAHMEGPHRRMSGFIMRSAVVSGWPDLQVEAFDSDRPDPAAETELLFEAGLDPLAALLGQADLSEENTMTQIRQIFQKNNIALSNQVTIDQRAWFITDDDRPVYELTQTANDKIDVRARQENAFPFAGQIDADLEADLHLSRRSVALRRAFKALKIELPEAFDVVGSRWFLSDGGVINYLLEREENKFRVYRDYRLPLLRFERLSGNVLIGLFEGVIRSVDFRLKPEAIHHGVSAGDSGAFIKLVRDKNGTPQPERIVEARLREADLRVIDIPELAGKLALSGEPSEFALQMVEGVPKVRFAVK